MRMEWFVAISLAVLIATSGSILPVGAASSQKVVAAGKIRRGDLPPGWKGKPADKDDKKSTDTKAIVAGIPSCASVKRLVKDE